MTEEVTSKPSPDEGSAPLPVSAPVAASAQVDVERDLTLKAAAEAAALEVGRVSGLQRWAPKTQDLQPCTFYIRRKKRNCRLRAVIGTDKCSKHQPDALAASRARPVDPTTHTTLPTGGVRAGSRRLSSRKRMANPFAKHYRKPMVAPPLSQWYSDVERPLHIDIGCARGLFVEQLASKPPTARGMNGLAWNFLGVEIRDKLMDAATARLPWASQTPDESDAAGVDRNLAFIGGNINVSVRSLFCGSPAIPEGKAAEEEAGVSVAAGPTLASVTRRVSIMFPDPWVRKKHAKRRVVSPEFVDDITAVLRSGCEMLIASDWLEMAQSMYDCFDDHADWALNTDEEAWHGEAVDTASVPAGSNAGEEDKHAHSLANAEASAGAGSGAGAGASDEAEAEAGAHAAGAGEGAGDEAATLQPATPQRSYCWLRRSPLSVPTEREAVCELQWRPVYWARFVRK